MRGCKVTMEQATGWPILEVLLRTSGEIVIVTFTRFLLMRFRVKNQECLFRLLIRANEFDVSVACIMFINVGVWPFHICHDLHPVVDCTRPMGLQITQHCHGGITVESC